MERTEAVILLENELHDACWSAKKAAWLLLEINDDFFCYTDEVISPAAFQHLRGEYGRACAKADIAQCLLNEICKTLDCLLSE